MHNLFTERDLYEAQIAFNCKQYHNNTYSHVTHALSIYFNLQYQIQFFRQ